METTDGEVYSRSVILGRDEQRVALAVALQRPGLSVVTGGPGAGKTTLVRHAAQQAGRPLLTGGALSSLRYVPALPLCRAVRAALPTDDPALAVEAVRARLGEAVLLVDDAQWADELTLSLLAELSRHCRVVATVRTPGTAGTAAIAALRPVTTHLVELAPLSAETAAMVVRTVRADLSDAARTQLFGFELPAPGTAP